MSYLIFVILRLIIKALVLKKARGTIYNVKCWNFFTWLDNLERTYEKTIFTPPFRPPSNVPFPLPPAKTCAFITISFEPRTKENPKICNLWLLKQIASGRITKAASILSPLLQAHHSGHTHVNQRLYYNYTDCSKNLKLSTICSFRLFCEQTLVN